MYPRQSIITILYRLCIHTDIHAEQWLLEWELSTHHIYIHPQSIGLTWVVFHLLLGKCEDVDSFQRQSWHMGVLRFYPTLNLLAFISTLSVLGYSSVLLCNKSASYTWPDQVMVLRVLMGNQENQKLIPLKCYAFVSHSWIWNKYYCPYYCTIETLHGKLHHNTHIISSPVSWREKS